MKKLSAARVTGVLLVLFKLQLSAQYNLEANVRVIPPFLLPITYYKTTNLVFPYAIKSVDRGSKDILVQKAKGVENILQVKAGKIGFDQSNLTVITADGKLYSYVLDYIDTPGVLNIRYANATSDHPEALFSDVSINQAELQADAEIVGARIATIHGLKDRKYGMMIKVTGLYIKGDVLFCRINLKNTSDINYDIDQLRFYIRDQRTSKRTASQELEITPLYVKGDPSVIIGEAENVFVYALPKFTIPGQKYLVIEVMEKNGGRHLKIKLYNRTIVRAKLLT